MKLIATARRFGALRCSEQRCKKTRVIYVRLPEGNAGLCSKHWQEWLKSRRSTSAPTLKDDHG